MAKRVLESGGNFFGVVVFFAVVFGFLIYWKSEKRAMNSGEYGILVINLPPAWGGGYSDRLVRPGELKLVFPWQTLRTVDTQSKTIYWGTQPNQTAQPFLTATTSDGRAVEFACELKYKVDPKQVLPVLKNFGPENTIKIQLFVKPLVEEEITDNVAKTTLANLQNQVFRNKLVTSVKDRIATSVVSDGLNLESFYCSEFESDADTPA